MPDKINSEIFGSDEIDTTEMAEPLGPSDLTFDEALKRAMQVVARDFDADEQPDVSGIKHVVLKKGTYVTKVANYWSIRSRNTGTHKYNCLVLVSLRRTKERGWEFETEHKITLDDKAGDDAIEKLFNFLAVLPQLNQQGKFLVVNSENVDGRIEEILEAVSNSGQIVELVSQILSWVNSDPKAISGLIQLASDDPVRSRSLVAALNYGRYSKALEDFKRLVDEDHVENVYQDFLEEQFWMFGSEYSELLPKRELTRGMQLDFPLRRTVDGYLEVIEIKRPMGDRPLYIGDRYLQMRNDVTGYLSQVRDQLAAVDANKYLIQSEDGLLVDNVRAKLVVGRDYGRAEQLQALRRDNGDQNRVEILTFDQLIRIGERILTIMVEENPLLSEIELEDLSRDDGVEPPENLSDIPF